MPSVRSRSGRSDAKHRCKCNRTTLYQCRAWGFTDSYCLFHEKRKDQMKKALEIVTTKRR